MPGEPADSVTPPGGLRPAQLGIVAVGRVVLGHLSATLADLAHRGFLRIAEIPRSDDPDWLLTDLRDTQSGRDGLLRFEATLLDGLLSRQQVQLSALGQDLIPVLGNVRVQLRRDAVRAGRLQRFRREQRTKRGERLLEEIHDFRRSLRTLAASGRPGALAELAPYAMIFGLPVPATVSLTGAPGVIGHTGPYPVVWARLQAHGISAGVMAAACRPPRCFRHSPGPFSACPEALGCTHRSAMPLLPSRRFGG